MVKRTSMAVALMAALWMGAATGCAGTVAVGAQYSGPDLVYVGPGIWVVEDYQYPVFYSDSYYWWWINGAWYRSVYLNNPNYVRVRVDAVPGRVRSIRQPERYRRYRAPANVQRRRVERREAPARGRTAPARRDQRRVAPPPRGRGPERGRQEEQYRGPPPGQRGNPGRGANPPGRGGGNPGRGGGDHGRGGGDHGRGGGHGR